MRQANGAVSVRYGGSVVLVSSCMSRTPREGVLDFLPLTVEYLEKTYAAGRIPGGFFKREGRPSENEILSARLIDRSIRPLFKKGFSQELQVIATVVSADKDYDPDILAVIGASSALFISDIPYHTPIGCCRIGYIDGNFILNPTYKEREESLLDLVCASTEEKIVMVETKACSLQEELLLEALKFAHEQNKEIIKLQKKLRELFGKPKREPIIQDIPPQMLEVLETEFEDKIMENLAIADKTERLNNFDLLVEEGKEKLKDKFGEEELEKVKLALYKIQEGMVRKNILETLKRPDGRKPQDLRPVSCQVNVLPRTHGSSLFTRGQTQSLAVTTLGTTQDMQLIDALEGETFKHFMLHYSFPPFSVGEIKPLRGPSRREIGHGNLAEKALQAVLPSKEDFPYTIRVVSEILESNGSSSMATVCAGSLSLMDAGVPIKEHVAGIALGLVEEGENYVILTDIAGIEDHCGDMDFKVAGTKEGITAVQVDVKNLGLSFKIIEEALKQAKSAREKILELMCQTISQPRPQISPLAPRITILKIDPEKIGNIIGPGGKTIRKIISQTGATIDIENDGQVTVSTPDKESQEKTLKILKGLVEDVEVGNIYEGTITRITNFGAFCEILPGKSGLIHISEISDEYVKNVSDFLKVGDRVRVKVIGVDDLGRITLSKKQADAQGSDKRG